VEVRQLRRDAEVNRQRILAAAADLFAVRGYDVCVDDIAREAGVGVGTLYRRFPHKADLIQAIVRNAIDACRELAIRVRDTEEPGEALFLYLRHSVLLPIPGRALISPYLWSEPGLTLIESDVVPFLAELMEGAKRAGTLRADVEMADLMVVFHSVRHLRDVLGDAGGDSWARHVELLLDGLRPAAVTAGLPGRAAELSQLAHAFRDRPADN
jgi:AcrR family transcriptional regulator